MELEQELKVDEPKGVYDGLYEKLMKKTAKEFVKMIDRKIEVFKKLEKEGGRNKKMKVMISQPMNGKTNKQIREERAKLVENLERAGLEVIDTIVAEEPPVGVDGAIFYLSKSIEFISKVDIVYFMKGWENARGCKIENKICQEYGKPTMYNIYEN